MQVDVLVLVFNSVLSTYLTNITSLHLLHTHDNSLLITPECFCAFLIIRSIIKCNLPHYLSLINSTVRVCLCVGCASAGVWGVMNAVCARIYLPQHSPVNSHLARDSSPRRPRPPGHKAVA